jgi:preprotein translocase subunit SecF
MRWCSTSISFITFLAAVFFLFTRGLHLSIEFTGGTVMEVEYRRRPTSRRCAATVDTLNFGEVQVQNFGTSRDVLIRLPVRGDVKQAEVVTRVFGAVQGRGRRGRAPAVTTDKGEAGHARRVRQGGAEPVQAAAQRVRRPVGRQGTGARRRAGADRPR